MTNRPMFQKRQYQAIAEAMQAQCPGVDAPDSPVKAAWRDTITALGDVFRADNAKFERGRFERACVPGANVRARS